MEIEKAEMYNNLGELYHKFMKEKDASAQGTDHMHSHIFVVKNDDNTDLMIG